MTSQTFLTAGKVLAVDTSGTRGTIALGHFENGQVKRVDQVGWEKKAIHSEIATLKLQELFTQASLSAKDLTHLAVNVGPGSFTGIRVGVNLTRTLAYSLNLPVFSGNTLHLLAGKGGASGESAFVAVKAIQNFYYCAGVHVTDAGLDERLAPSSQSDLDLGKLSETYTKVLIEGQTSGFSPITEASDLLHHLARWPDHSRFLSWKEVRPVYIRASEAEEKLLKGLLNREF